jgi:hypothetical protein
MSPRIAGRWPAYRLRLQVIREIAITWVCFKGAARLAAGAP